MRLLVLFLLAAAPARADDPNHPWNSEQPERDWLKNNESPGPDTHAPKKLDPNAGTAPAGETGELTGLFGGEGAGSSGGEAGVGGGAGAAAAARAQAAAPSASGRAMSRANAAAASLKQAMASPDGPGGLSAPRPGANGNAAGAKMAAAGPAGAAPPAASPGPANQGLDLVAAAGSGYRGVFKDMHLTAGSGPDGRATILDSAGRPADEATLAGLRQRLAAEPGALAKRPDFFGVISRESHAGLKSAIKAPGAEGKPEFKHVGTTADDRDFVWTESCDGVSGDCNQYAAEGSYKKSSDISPESLRNIWEHVDEKGRAMNSPGAGNAGALAARGGASLLERFSSLIRSFGISGPSGDAVAVTAFAGPASGPRPAGGEARTAGSRSRGVPSLSAAPAPPGGRARPAMIALLLACAGGVFFVSRRKKI